jgi:hypothetical protein
MEALERDQKQETERPSCFGNEVKFIGHMDGEAPESECARCPSENECGEFILFKCSRELMF